MTTAERRLEQLTHDLTARERAILVMQHWLREEEFDKKLRDQVPADQKDEYERIVRAVEGSNNDLHWALVFEQLYLFEAEIHLAWLESLGPALERIKILEKALKAKGVKVREGAPRRRAPRTEEVVVPAMPVITRGWDLQEPLFGVRTGEDFASESLAGDQLVKGLVRQVRENLVLRAQVVATVKIIAGEMTDAFDGYNAVHKNLEHALQDCARMLARLYAAAQKFGDFELSPPTDEQVELRRTWTDLEDIRGTPPTKNQSGQQGESEYAKKQREEANAAWREQLEAERGRRDGIGEDTDVFTPGTER